MDQQGIDKNDPICQTIGIFLRKVMILLQSVNRMPFFKIVDNITFSGLNNRNDFTAASISQFLNYFGIKEEDVELPKLLDSDAMDLPSLASMDLPETILFDLNLKKKVLIDLPKTFAELSILAQKFKCPKIEELTVGSRSRNPSTSVDQNNTSSLTSTSNTTLRSLHQSSALTVGGKKERKIVMCLLTGKILCMKGRCCQENYQITLDPSITKPCGPVYRHALENCNGFVMILCFNKNKILCGTIDPEKEKNNTIHSFSNSQNNRLIPVPTPYVDKFGEFDMGLERGCPLSFDQKYYDYLQDLFLTGELIEVFKKQRFNTRRGSSFGEPIELDM